MHLPAPHVPTTTLGYLRPVLRLLHANGFDFNALQGRWPLAHQAAVPVRERVPVSLSRELMQIAALHQARWGKHPLWRALILHTQYSDFGGLGLSLEAGGDLLGVLQRIATYHPLVSDAITLSMSVTDHVCRLQCLFTTDQAPHRQSILYLIGVLVSYCRSRSDNHFLPRCIGLLAPCDEEMAELSAYCGCPVVAASVTYIEFPLQTLHAPLNDSDPELVSSLEPVLQGRLNAQTSTYTAKLQHWLRMNLGETPPRLGAAAAALHLSERSLQRRLQEEGVSWTALVQSTRQQIMDPILASADTPITDIALTLGYTHATSFSRAFRRHFGMTPRHYRKKRLSDR